jgi:DNA-directed RNA polymerase specialized sigma24 family protein
MLDPALTGLVEAGDDDEAEARLDALLSARIQPLVRAVAARKLGIYGGFSPHDVEDVVGDALLVLVERLRAVRRDPAAGAIAALDGYAATITYHACTHAIRQRHPRRARLKARIRYVLTHDAGCGVWDDAGGGAVAGLAAWRPQPASDAAHTALDAPPSEIQQAALARQARAAESPAGLGALVKAVLGIAGGPVEVDRLVATIARLCGVRDVPPTGEPPQELPAPIEAVEARMDDQRFVARVWTEVGGLPIRQRIALLLNLRDTGGGGVLWLLPAMGLATIRQVARLLEMPDRELAELWPRLPLDDLAIAARLGCTRQQVINLRMSARKRLATRLRALHAGLRGAGVRDRSRAAGNLAAVPSSMDSET